jgi:hypothetical protein
LVKKHKKFIQVYKTLEMETYLVHYNYDTPFRIENYTDEKKVHIFDLTYNTETIVKYQKIFTGSQTDPINTVLINTHNNNYIFSGRVLKKFTSIDPIVDYFSVIGRNDVPYPYAIDSKNRYYLLIENVVLTKYSGDDPYDYYYNNSNMGSLIAGSVSRRKIKIKKGVRYITYERNENKNPFRDIYCIYIFNLDEDENICGDFQMSYRPFPENLGSMYIKYNDKRNLKVPITFKGIKKLHEEFGKLKGFVPLIMN